MINKNLKLLLIRNIYLVSQALFGFIPVIFLSKDFQFVFYELFLFLSYISMFTIGVEHTVASRAPRLRSNYIAFCIDYLFLITISTLIGSIFLFFIIDDIYTFFIVLICGLITNIKSILIGFLRSGNLYLAYKVMYLDILSHIFACFLLAFFLESKTLIFVSILIAKTPTLFLFFSLLPRRIKFRLSRTKFKYLSNILKNSLFFFGSAFLITYLPTLIKSLGYANMSNSEFISLSVSLSIAANINKVSASIYWVLQEKIFKIRFSKKLVKKHIKYACSIIPLSVLFYILISYIMMYVGKDLLFTINIYMISITFIFYRILISSTRSFLVREYGILYIFKKQATSVFVCILIVSLYYLFFSIFQPFLIVVIYMFIDSYITCYKPMRKKYKVY